MYGRWLDKSTICIYNHPCTALLTGAGAPVAAVASGVSVGLEIAGDPKKREQIRKAVNWVGEKAKDIGRTVKEKVQKTATGRAGHRLLCP